MKIQGCKNGKHRFTEPKVSSKPISLHHITILDGIDPYACMQSDASETVHCRHDWYQTQNSVIISVFAKKVNKTNTKVAFTTEEVRSIISTGFWAHSEKGSHKPASQLKVDVEFQDGKIFKFHTPLSQVRTSASLTMTTLDLQPSFFSTAHRTRKL